MFGVIDRQIKSTLGRLFPKLENEKIAHHSLSGDGSFGASSNSCLGRAYFERCVNTCDSVLSSLILGRAGSSGLSESRDRQ